MDIGYALIHEQPRLHGSEECLAGSENVSEEELHRPDPYRDQPGAATSTRQALAVCLGGNTLVVTKLDRLARSLSDAKDIVDKLARREVRLSIGGSLHGPADPVGGLLFDVRATVAEF